MKKIIVLVSLAFSIAVGTAHAQTINDIPFKDVNAKYVQIVGSSKFMSSNLRIHINFGSSAPMLPGQKENIIKDADGRVLEFTSMIDTLNFMAENGFELVSTYVAQFRDGDNNRYHYVLKKKDG